MPLFNSFKTYKKVLAKLSISSELYNDRSAIISGSANFFLKSLFFKFSTCKIVKIILILPEIT
jgi:hypothetical protein